MIESAWDYHRRTSYDRHDMTGHYMDWSCQPNVFKTYPGRETAALTQDIVLSQENLSDILIDNYAPVLDSEIDAVRLARILHMTHALTAKARHGGSDFYYRSVASAGALYPFELYIAALNVPNLDVGIYHHNVFSRSLTILRPGNPLSEVSRAIGIEEEGQPAAVFFLTSIFFRSSWKYRERAYRYHLLDTGHLVENLCLSLKSERLRFKLHYDFEDRTVNELLGLDTTREVCLAAACVWGTAPFPAYRPPGLGNLAPDLGVCSRVSTREIDYPVIREIHTAASALIEPKEELPEMIERLGIVVQSWTEVSMIGKSPEEMSYPDAVLQRRSMRNFVRDKMPWDYFTAILKALCSDAVTKDNEPWSSNSVLSIGFLSGNVEGLKPGFYLLDRKNHAAIGFVRESFMMEEMAHVCLDQAWLANSALHFLFMSNLNTLEQTWGPRGYRYAMLSAGRLGQRIYLAATSMRLGACGIGAFYDDEAVKLLGLNNQTNLLYLVCAGPIRKWSLPR